VTYTSTSELNHLEVVSLFDYDPYGNVLRSFISAPEKYLTTQHERDAETDLDYRGARFYDSEVGRFLSVDPLAVKYPSFSCFSFVLDNPIVFIDPDGREVIKSATFIEKKTEEFSVFSLTDKAQSILGKFASKDKGDYQNGRDGVLSRHTLEFDTKNPKGDAETYLMVDNGDGWDKVDMSKTVDDITKNSIFKVVVNMNSFEGNDEKTGYGAGMLNHEAVLWVEGYSNILEKWENGEITLDEFKTGLVSLNSNEHIDSQYKTVTNENSELNSTQNELIQLTSGNIKNGVTQFKSDDIEFRKAEGY
jgi:RHS repeat-associated protein